MERVVVKLLKVIFTQLPDESVLLISDYIHQAFGNKCLIDLKNFQRKSEGLSSATLEFLLTDDCIAYLLNQLLANPWLIQYLVHYDIKWNNTYLLRVTDEFCFSISNRFEIPISLIEECENNEIWIYMEDNP